MSKTFIERVGSFRFPNTFDHAAVASSQESEQFENEINYHEIPEDVWTINCGQKEPSSSVHAAFVPPIGEIISLLPLAYRLRYASRFKIINL